ncbi:hypothetical protein EDF59_12376 [Novosphingobium sp. ST904]|nr:hypothetical protein EDF59_12376 [Novosphingobium sp. ST904]
MTTDAASRPDHNALGKAAFIVGLIGLILSFIPLIGFVSWILGPLAILFGLIALLRKSRSLAIAGIVTGVLTLYVCYGWIKGTQSLGEAMNKDAFNTSGETFDMANAPIIDATIKGIWKDVEGNKIAAGEKYGKHRLRFTKEVIQEFGGDASAPVVSFTGKTEDYLTHFVSASFAAKDGKEIGSLKKGARISFICEDIRETFGDGYSLGGCSLK